MAGLLTPKRKVLGADVAGIVEAIGVNVKQFQSGDAVFGLSFYNGAFAEYLCAPEAQLLLVSKPASVSFENAAAIPTQDTPLWPACVIWEGFNNSGGLAKENSCLNNGYHGISVRDQARPVLEGNACQDNLEAGLAYFGKSGGVARQNDCSDNRWGIYISENANPQLENNNCYNNDEGNIVDKR